MRTGVAAGLRGWSLVNLVVASGVFLATPLAPAAAQVQPGAGSAPSRAAKAKPAAKRPVAKQQKLDLNDISILFPPPKAAEDMSRLISMNELRAGGQANAPVFTETAFRAFTTISENFGTAGGQKIQFESRDKQLKQLADWHIAGIRIDPGAPGLDPAIVKEFGRSPQIRLIVQPVTRDGNSVIVHDFAAHLIFDFKKGSQKHATAGCFDKGVPDDAAFKKIVGDLRDLKSKLASGGFANTRVSTAGDMDVHPGLANAQTGRAVRDEIKRILETHLRADKLTSMASMGLPNGFEPWIFAAMVQLPAGTPASALPAPLQPLVPLGYIPVASPTLEGPMIGQMLSFLSGAAVVPAPVNNNGNPITCRFNRPLPGGANLLPVKDSKGQPNRNGVSTAELYQQSERFDSAVVPTTRSTKEGKRVNQIVDTVASVAKSHFFNTDCVSCHTETHRARLLLTPPPRFSHINPAVLPDSKWNVRNFGWFATALAGNTPAQATITRRTKTETLEVLHFINSGMLK